MYKYVIALNQGKVDDSISCKQEHQDRDGKLTALEVAKIMNIVRKYPKRKIKRKELFTCGFSMN